MNVLVVNCGSSSIKLDLLDPATGVRVKKASVERVGSEGCSFAIDGGDAQALAGADHLAALKAVLPALLGELRVDCVGHRVVHGGERFNAPVRIDDEVEAAIEALVPLAPLHNPGNLSGIRAARAVLPDVPHVAVFDTAFHATLPTRAKTYALPVELATKHGIRRYGFHGPSHQYVANRAAEALGEDIRDLRIITCHLGNGASVTAVEYGRSVETSMGLTPLEGLVMGTRAGDVDAGALLTLMREEGLDADALDKLLNKESGLAGLSGVGNDLRDIEARAAEGDERCRLAIQVFCHRLRKYIGAYAAVLGGVDVIVFTAGIGENSATIRHRVLQRLDFLGARLDEDKNRSARVSQASPTAVISEDHSRTRLMVVATDEAQAIAAESAKLAAAADKVDGGTRIPIAISARHVHLNRQTVALLFGEGAELTPYKPLSQPGQFACEQKVNIIGPKGRIDGLRVLGPVRSQNQVEIARTDEFKLGVDAPVRDSGDTAQSAPITLEGPAGTVQLTEGLICARRHIHMHPDDAARFGVADKDVVEVAVDTDGRDLIFGDVLVRVSPKYALEMHLDTDEANAAEITPDVEGVLAPTHGSVRLLRKRTEFVHG
ncbi:MAG: acetate/propionate family kinase [Sandaracinaceae bacterium]|nr:acetate/propionate family kinase [Sandaracinaceae bacterium]